MEEAQKHPAPFKDFAAGEGQPIQTKSSKLRTLATR